MSLVDGVLRTTSHANFDVSDGGTLFYVAGGVPLMSPLVWVDRDGSAEPIEAIPPNGYMTPRLSPDGDRVLVVAEGDAWVYDIASGRESRITTDQQTLNDAGWTPSGDHVTYTSARAATENVWIQPADGSGAPEQMTALDGRVHFDSWASDGKTFSAHVHAVGAVNQLMVAFDGTAADPDIWLDRPYPETDAVFSPDGRYVAHRSVQTGESEIYIRPFPGPGGQTPVSVDGGVEPVWGRNGELFYRRGSDYAMMAVEVSTKSYAADWTARHAVSRRYAPPGISETPLRCDGGWPTFLMSASLLASGQDDRTDGPQVHVVLNWTEELMTRVPRP